MAANHDLISAINPAKESWTIKARVVRLWFVSDFNRQALPFSMEMVLMDENGDKIHASVRKSLIYRFERDLMEGSVYSMSYFGVASNAGSFRTTRHQYKLNFQYGTKVVNIDKTFVKASPFSLVPFSEITDSYNTDYLLDVMGICTAVGTERQYERNGAVTKMNVIELDSDGFKLECALFGPYVDDLNSFLASGEVQLPVVIIHLAKVKSYQGRIQLQNAMSCTKIFFNPECNEAVEFRKRIKGINDSPSLALSQLADTPKISVEDDFLFLTHMKTIEALKDCKEDGSCVVLGTIKHVLEGDEWWYTACTCNKAVYPDSKMFFCEKCNKHVLNVVPRYRIKLRVIDHSDSATFVVFDRDATALLKRSCSEMVDSVDKSPGASGIPKEILDLVDKTFLFKVELRSGVNTRFEQSYRVKKLCADEAIIQKFISKFPSPDVVVQEGPSGESVAQDLMPKFVDVAVHTQPQHTDPKIDDVTTDSVALNPADVDVCGDNSVNDESSQNVVSLTHDTVVSSALNADPGDKSCDLPNVPNSVTPVKRGLIASVDAESGIIPMKAIKIEKD